MALFKSPIGQSGAIAQLEAAMTQNRLASAYLFTGPKGVGRKLTARWLFQKLLNVQDRNTTHSDTLWIEPVFMQDGQHYTEVEAEQIGLTTRSRSQIRVDQIRQITAFLQQPPLLTSRSLIVIDGAETMSEAAANALLKVLEEPGQATLILIAQTSNHLLPTIYSRCQTIRFKRLTPELLAQVMEELCPNLMHYPDLIRFAQGSPGRAIAAWRNLQRIPCSVIEALNQTNRSIWGCLSVSQKLQTLDLNLQLWLLNYLQFQTWQRLYCVKTFDRFEQAQLDLSQHCQAQLVWDCLLTSLPNIKWTIPSSQELSVAELPSKTIQTIKSTVISHPSSGSLKPLKLAKRDTASSTHPVNGRQTNFFNQPI